MSITAYYFMALIGGIVVGSMATIGVIGLIGLNYDHNKEGVQNELHDECS